MSTITVSDIPLEGKQAFAPAREFNPVMAPITGEVERIADRLSVP
jgi:hypothetical protein